MQFLQLVISGVAQGCIYGLIALGFVLIYKATETVNFAQGDLMMLGGFLGLSCMVVLGMPFWVAFLATLAVAMLFGMLMERALLRPLLGQPAFTVVMLTIGIGYLARGLVTMIPGWGTETHTLPVPYKDEVLRLGSGGDALVLSMEHMVVIVMDGRDDDRHLGELRHQRADQLFGVAVGQGPVDHRQAISMVRDAAVGFGQGRGAIHRSDFGQGRPKQTGQPLSGLLQVLDNQDAGIPQPGGTFRHGIQQVHP